MPCNFVPDRFHTKKLCSRLSSSEVRFWTEIDCFAFLSSPPPLGDFGATYDDHLRLIGGDFLLVLVELFSLRHTTLWNDLPQSVKDVVSINKFKQSVKLFFKSNIKLTFFRHLHNLCLLSFYAQRWTLSDMFLTTRIILMTLWTRIYFNATVVLYSVDYE